MAQIDGKKILSEILLDLFPKTDISINDSDNIELN